MQSKQTTLGDFLDALAAKQSTPGGGGAAALTGSQAAALVSMVANFTLERKKYADVRGKMETVLAQSETLRAELLDLVDRDGDAFGAVMDAYGLPKSTGEEKFTRTEAIQQAMKGAADVPLFIAQKCVEVLRLAETAARGNANVVSDAAAALYLARAAIDTAIINVNINLKFIRDDDFVRSTSQYRDALLSEADAAYNVAKASCEQTLEIAL